MNKAEKQLDELITNWRLWAERSGHTETIANLDVTSMGKVAKHLENMKRILQTRGYESAYFKGLKK